MSTEINYNLAKQLKDSGFPQIRKDNRLVYLNDGTKILFDLIRHAQEENGMIISYEEKLICIPTLSELIEECRDRFIGLDRCDGVTDPTKKVWKSVAYKDDKFVYQINSTPEEAVGNLWLALNKK